MADDCGLPEPDEAVLTEGGHRPNGAQGDGHKPRVKKPAGKWEKVAGAAYGEIQPDPETGLPLGLGLDTIPGFAMLMRENKDRLVFAGMTGRPKL